jgi:starch synthase
VRVVLVDRPELYDRASIYGMGSDYPDNPRRFAFLCRAALEYAIQTNQPFDVLHTHDWQAGLAPVYLRTRYAGHPLVGGMATVFTIHNLAYQGTFAPDWLGLLDLPPDVLSIEGLEFWGRLSFLKGGITSSQVITTVSPTYAKEIQTKEYGAGFEGILSARADRLFGVLNGIDVDTWNPAKDPHLPQPYDESSLDAKAASRAELMQVLGSRINPKAVKRPLVGVVSRLVDQKGFDLVAELAPILPTLGFSFAVIGTGDPRYETMWRELAAKRPDLFAVRIGFDERTAHLIEAGADIFLMPSRFEPCGLNQMYSMRYGTVPVVRATGGLEDTVVDYNPRTETGTGFKFSSYTADALRQALERAREAFANPSVWKKLQLAGMRQDFSWDRSAGEYVKLYERARLELRPTGLSAEGRGQS